MSREARIKQAPTKDFKLGLERHGLQYFEITNSTYEMPYIRGEWQHGLNEADKKTVENHYGHKFDNKDHFQFWADLGAVDLDHTIQGVDLSNPVDILKIGILRGMKVLANDIDEASDSMAGYGFYLSNVEEEEEHKSSLYERRDQAIADLLNIRKSAKYIVAFAKYTLPKGIQVNDATSAYIKMRDFLDGKLKTVNSKGKNDALNSFEATKKLEKNLLYATVDYRMAVRQNIIRLNNDQRYYNTGSNTILGKNEEECVKFLLDPKNQDELGMGHKNDKTYSIRNQLKN